jgi:steroid delta-isomerase
VARSDEIKVTIEAHVAAVGAADADAVAALYPADAELQDQAGTRTWRP